ncbi:MAG: HEAT repeat domain-containing protein [Planctomycetota bacterium]
MKNLLVTLFAAFSLVLPSSASTQDEANLPDDVGTLVKTLKEKRDNADVAMIKKLSNKKTREAMEGLIEVYDTMLSIYMRRAVCQGLALYDDVNDSWQPALEKLMNVSVEAKERELREASVELLGGCRNYGGAFLKMIVESSADDDIRKRAMVYHVARRNDEDKEWYREIYDPTAEERAKKAAKKARDEKDKVPHQLQPLRELCFEALLPDMEPAEIVEAASDKNRKIRALALEELSSRGDKKAVTVAEEVYERQNEPVPTRLVAARILIHNMDAKFADQLIKDATKKAIPREFSFGIADLLVEMNDEGVNKKLLKKAGKGKGDEKLFYLRATAHLEDAKLDKSLVKLLKDKDPEVRRVVAQILGDRRTQAALPELAKMIDKGEEPLVLTAAIEATTSIRRNDAEWEQALLSYAKHDELDIRNSALAAIGRTRNSDYLPVVIESLESKDWSTRLAAARAIEAMRKKEGVGPLCSRIGKEVGRMSVELGDILFRLTGKSFTNARAWENWWKQEGDSFKLISESKLRQLEDEEEARRLKQISRTEFFGISIESHRVIFILDVSGSMEEPTRGKYVGENGTPRIEVAKSELMKAIGSLDLNSLFNIITFNSAVDSWQDRIVEKTEATLEEARGFVDRLGAAGGTNLYASLEFAFEDPDVDTIFVMSDGEPTVGEITDGMTIREVVQSWNKNREVVIHTIAVGGSLQVLEWLSEDTGGTHVKFP